MTAALALIGLGLVVSAAIDRDVPERVWCAVRGMLADAREDRRVAAPVRERMDHLKQQRGR